MTKVRLSLMCMSLSPCRAAEHELQQLKAQMKMKEADFSTLETKVGIMASWKSCLTALLLISTKVNPHKH